MMATPRINIRSWSLMERLGMRRIAEADLDHPPVPKDGPLPRRIARRADRTA